MIYRGSTENIVKTTIQALQSGCIELCMYNLTNANIRDVDKELVDSYGIVVGTFYILRSIHLNVTDASDLVKVVNSAAKFCAKHIKNKRGE